MLKSLVADRFRLKVRQETREFDVYDLVVDKGGRKLKTLAEGESFHCTRDNTLILRNKPVRRDWRLAEANCRATVMDKTKIERSYEILLDLDTYQYRSGTRPADYDKPSPERCFRNSWDFGW